MTHFVLYARRARLSDEAIEHIADTAGVTVLDSEIDGALLIDTTPDGADKLREQFPDWIIAEEVEYPSPELKPYTIEDNDS